MRNWALMMPRRDYLYGGPGTMYSGIINGTNTKDKKDEKYISIIRFLYGVGIPVTSIGFHYFCTAINICMHDRLASTNAQKNIYMVIADHYNVSYKSVERAIRVAFTEEASQKAMYLFTNEMHLFPENISEEMTPLEFISLAALVVS